MELIYFTNERIPSPSACTIQQMYMCQAFANNGKDVTLVRPYYWDNFCLNKDQIRRFYKVKSNFDIKTLPTLLSLSNPDNQHSFRIPYIGGVSMLLITFIYLLGLFSLNKINKDTIIYSRNLNATIIAIYLNKLRRRKYIIIFEVHALNQQPQYFLKLALTHSYGIVCITKFLRDTMVDKFKLDKNKILIAADGARQDQLIVSSKKHAREKIQMANLSKYLIVYTGQILPGKGVNILLNAARKLSDEYLILIVGGNQQQIKQLQTVYDDLKNIKFTGFVEPNKISWYQRAADVLVLPNTQEGPIHKFTSPLKLFEYMSANRPIVASNLPVFREILDHEKNIFFVEPGNDDSLAEGIQRMIMDVELAKKISQNAYNLVRQYTWEKRAQKILNFIHSIKIGYEKE